MRQRSDKWIKEAVGNVVYFIACWWHYLAVGVMLILAVIIIAMPSRERVPFIPINPEKQITLIAEKRVSETCVLSHFWDEWGRANVYVVLCAGAAPAVGVK